jgi:hypothetical protein
LALDKFCVFFACHDAYAGMFTSWFHTVVSGAGSAVREVGTVRIFA